MRAGQPHERLRHGLKATARLQRHFAGRAGAAANGSLISAVRPLVRFARRCAISRHDDGLPSNERARWVIRACRFRWLGSRPTCFRFDELSLVRVSSAEKRKMHVKCGRHECDRAPGQHGSESERSLLDRFEQRRDPSEIIGVFRQMCRRAGRDETILTNTKPFSAFGASRKKPPMVIRFTTTTAHRRPRNLERHRCARSASS